jgi:chromosome segregation ATPase
MERCAKCNVTHWVGGECPARDEASTLEALESELNAIPGEVAALEKFALAGQNPGAVLAMIDERRAREKTLRLQVLSQAQQDLKGEIEGLRRQLKGLTAELEQAAGEVADAETEDSRVALAAARDKLNALLEQRSGLHRAIADKTNKLGVLLSARPTI